jgi:hypothetical protein
MKANDSLECRNCHSSESMDLTKQNLRAALAHERFLFSGERTCIDCHKGRVHRPPPRRRVASSRRSSSGSPTAPRPSRGRPPGWRRAATRDLRSRVTQWLRPNSAFRLGLLQRLKTYAKERSLPLLSANQTVQRLRFDAEIAARVDTQSAPDGPAVGGR